VKPPFFKKVFLLGNLKNPCEIFPQSKLTKGKKRPSPPKYSPPIRIVPAFPTREEANPKPKWKVVIRP